MVIINGAAKSFGGFFDASKLQSEGPENKPKLREIWSCGKGNSKVVRIPVRGVLVQGDSRGLFPVPGPVETAMRHILAATADQNVKAIILEINSPGGSVSDCDRMYKSLMDFKASQDDRKVVAIFKGIAASGGYYIAAAADHIVSEPTTMTGSIGVVMSSLNLKGLSDHHGIKMVTIKSGANKDLLNPFEEVSPEQVQLLQELVTEMYERFLFIIRKARPDIPDAELRRVADGRVFSSEKARAYGLIDKVGYWEDVIEATGDLLDVDEIKVIRYGDEFSFASLLRSYQPQKLATSDLLDLSRARLMYMWQAR